MLGDLPVFVAILAGLIYLVGHVLRAFRLAVLSMDMLGTSARTVALMHFATAPLALPLPYKSGELWRLHQLWRLSGTALYALVILLIDRMYDSLFLLPVVLILTVQGNAASALVLLTLLAAVVPMVVLLVGPQLLTQAQRHVLVNHNNPKALDVLRHIDALRALVARVSLVARNRAAELCLLSFLIWLCELIVCLLLVNAVADGARATFGRAFDLLGVRLVAPWWNLGADPLAGPAVALATIALLLPWPIVVYFYLGRRRSEPRRMPTIWRRDPGMTK
jgi:hypothetical protein